MVWNNKCVVIVKKLLSKLMNWFSYGWKDLPKYLATAAQPTKHKLGGMFYATCLKQRLLVSCKHIWLLRERALRILLQTCLRTACHNSNTCTSRHCLTVYYLAESK